MASAMIQARLPQPQEYQHPGAYMRDLRLYYGLDVTEVAARIHIRAKYIQAIEEGRLEQMPGKVYARGYIVTYAEFLGLDAEAFATQYMGEGAAPAREVKYFVPEPKRVRLKARARRVPLLLVALVVVGGGAWALMSQNDTPGVVAVSGVEDVPERLVESMRNGLMPIASNYDCLMGHSMFACQLSRATDRLMGFTAAVPRQFVDATRVVVVDVDAAAADAAVEAASEDTRAAEAEVKKAGARDEPKQAAPFVPQAKVPAPTPKPEPKKAAVKEKEKEKVPDAAPAKLPFRQGPSLPEGGAAMPAPTEPVAEPKQEPEPEPVAEDDGESRWWDNGLAPADPNASRQELFPRRRR